MSMSMAASRAARKTKKLTSAAALFPVSAGGVLKVSQSLLETLAIDEGLLRLTSGNSPEKLKKLIAAVEQAWAAMRDSVDAGDVNFVVWFSGLVRESYETGLWMPPIFIKRLRQLQRGNLTLYDSRGEPVPVPRNADPPAAFLEWTTFTGWGFQVVRRWDGRYERLEDGTDATGFVEVICQIWPRRPRSRKHAEEWLRAELKAAGWSVG